MTKDYNIQLHDSVTKFKLWAKNNYPMVTEYNDNGEWEILSDEFYDMREAIVTFIKNVPSNKATDQSIDDIIYGIARDNECNYIMEVLEEYTQWYVLLCRRCLKTNYINAMW